MFGTEMVKTPLFRTSAMHKLDNLNSFKRNEMKSTVLNFVGGIFNELFLSCLVGSYLLYVYINI